MTIIKRNKNAKIKKKEKDESVRKKMRCRGGAETVKGVYAVKQWRDAENELGLGKKQWAQFE